MKLLVTGIAGFIGSHLAQRLIARGDTVAGIDSFDGFYPRTIKEQNLLGLGPAARVIEGDILDAEVVDRACAMEEFDAVVHLAGLAGVRPSLSAASLYQRVNVEGTTRIAEACVRHKISRMIFASSSSVYGANRKVPFAETDRVDEPLSPYAASKRAAELVLQSMHHVHGLGVTVLRYFTVYGPRQRPEMAVHAFCRAMENGDVLTLFGDGTSSRDYTYIDDAIDGTVAAIDRSLPGFRIYNLGGERPVALKDVVARLAGALGREPRIELVPEAPGDVRHTLASIEAARADLGYAPRVDIDEGIRRFVEWYRHR
jgi:UDP-glucuronate 4-epimerase